MIRHLTRLGDQFAIVIDPAVLELLGIDETTALDVRTDGIGFSIRPADAGARSTMPSPPAATPAAPVNAGPPVAPRRSDALVDGGPPRVSPSGPPSGSPSGPPSGPPSGRAGASQQFVSPPATSSPVQPPASSALPPAASSPAPRASPPASGVGDDLPNLPDTTQSLVSPDEPLAATPKIVVLLGDQVVMEHPFTDDEVVVGRNKQAQIHLDDRALSRDHCKLFRRGAAIWVSDLGSANGTFVNEERLTEARPLHGGEFVVIGRYRLRIDGVEEARQDTPVLTITGPDGSNRFAMIGSEIVIGRSDECDVSINNRTVSRRHLQISLGKGRGQFLATNISGRNVVKVNGVAVADQADFKMGDPLEIGEFSITVGYLEPEKAATPSGKPRTMLIDRSALAKAAFVDGDGAVAPGGRMAR